MANNGTSMLDPPPIVVIRTERLEMRTLQMSDLDDILPIITDNEVMKWTTQGPVENRDQGQRWLSARALGPNVFNFILKDHSSAVVGICGSSHWPEFGYLVKKSRSGKGYATEAVRAFIPAYFERVPSLNAGIGGYDYLEAVLDIENVASQRVLTKCNFELCEELSGNSSDSVSGRGLLIFRLPRTGKTLREFGLDAASIAEPPDEAFEPPIQ